MTNNNDVNLVFSENYEGQDSPYIYSIETGIHMSRIKRIKLNCGLNSTDDNFWPDIVYYRKDYVDELVTRAIQKMTPEYQNIRDRLEKFESMNFLLD